MADNSMMAMRRDLLRQRGEAEYTQKRQEIVTAAADVFKRKGFRSANLRDIAAAAAMDRATLYLYISGKEEVFQDVVLNVTRANVGMVESLQAGEVPVPDKLTSLVRQLMESYARNYPFMFVYVQENLTQLDDGSDWSREMRALGRRFDDAVTAIVQQGLDQNILQAHGGGNAKVIAYGIIGICNWSHRWFKPDGACTAAQIGETYAGMVLDGLIVR